MATLDLSTLTPAAYAYPYDPDNPIEVLSKLADLEMQIWTMAKDAGFVLSDGQPSAADLVTLGDLWMYQNNMIDACGSALAQVKLSFESGVPERTAVEEAENILYRLRSLNFAAEMIPVRQQLLAQIEDTVQHLRETRTLSSLWTAQDNSLTATDAYLNNLQEEIGSNSGADLTLKQAILTKLRDEITQLKALPMTPGNLQLRELIMTRHAQQLAVLTGYPGKTAIDGEVTIDGVLTGGTSGAEAITITEDVWNAQTATLEAHRAYLKSVKDTYGAKKADLPKSFDLSSFFDSDIFKEIVKVVLALIPGGVDDTVYYLLVEYGGKLLGYTIDTLDKLYSEGATLCEKMRLEAWYLQQIEQSGANYQMRCQVLDQQNQTIQSLMSQIQHAERTLTAATNPIGSDDVLSEISETLKLMRLDENIIQCPYNCVEIYTKSIAGAEQLDSLT